LRPIRNYAHDVIRLVIDAWRASRPQVAASAPDAEEPPSILWSSGEIYPEPVQSMMYLLEDEVGVVARSAARRRSCWNGTEEALAWAARPTRSALDAAR
jgi:hypothetical protein